MEIVLNNNSMMNNLEKAKQDQVETQAARIKEQIAEAAAKAIEKNEQKKEEIRREVVKEAPKFMMNDLHIKELFLMFSSKGNYETVEKLAAIIKKQKEMAKYQ